MTIPLPTGSISPAAAAGILEGLRVYPAARLTAIAAYNNVLPIANLVMQYAQDPATQQLVRADVDNLERAINNGSRNIVGLAFDWARTRNVMGVSLSGQSLDSYFAGDFTDDQLRALVYGVVVTGAGTNQLQRVQAAVQEVQNVPAAANTVTNRYLLALRMTRSQADALIAGGAAPATPTPATPSSLAPTVGPLQLTTGPPAGATAAAASVGLIGALALLLLFL